MRTARPQLDSSVEQSALSSVHTAEPSRGGDSTSSGRQRRASGGSVPASAKAKRMRNQLLLAAREVFERDGFLNARVTDIAAAAGASHGSFYTYFDSKTDIFRNLIEEVMDDLYTTLGTARHEGFDGGPVARIQQSNRRFVAMYQANAPLLALFEQVTTFDEQVRQLRLRVRERIVTRLSSSIRRMQTAGQVREDLDPHCTASLLISMTNSTVHYWLGLGEEFDEELLLLTMDQVWAGALGLPTHTS